MEEPPAPKIDDLTVKAQVDAGRLPERLRRALSWDMLSLSLGDAEHVCWRLWQDLRDLGELRARLEIDAKLRAHAHALRGNSPRGKVL